MYVDPANKTIYPPSLDVINIDNLEGMGYANAKKRGYSEAPGYNFDIVGPKVGEWLLSKVIGFTPTYYWEEWGRIGYTNT